MSGQRLHHRQASVRAARALLRVHARHALEKLGCALTEINRPTRTRRIPSVLTKDEVAGLLSVMEGETALLARLLYRTGMCLREGMRLRLKHVEFDRHNIIMREAKGNVSTTMIYTHVIKATSGGTASPLDALMGAAALA